MQFTGIFGPAGKPGDRSETVYFAGGKFWTRECIPCGFGPALYTARRTGSEIYFSGHLLSAEKGRLYYEGVLRDRRLSVKVNWRKERWYWVIDRNFHFEGELASELGTGGERLRVSSPAENFHSEQGGDCKL